jgi:uncharacterized protein YcbK (DUF882 family)
MDWNSITFFKAEEFHCSCCNHQEMNAVFVQRLDELRRRCSFPFVVTSGWRCPRHHIEAAKKVPGWHNKGRAVDIACTDSAQRYQLVKEAMAMGTWGGIGVYETHVHLDDRHPLTGQVFWYG